MDPVSAAILAAISAGALAGISQTAQSSVVDLYQALRAKIIQKFRRTSDVTTALEQIEARPESSARRALLEEEIARSGMAKDPEIVDIAQKILELLAAKDDTHSQVAIGSYIAQADRQSNATVSIENPRGQ